MGDVFKRCVFTYVAIWLSGESEHSSVIRMTEGTGERREGRQREEERTHGSKQTPDEGIPHHRASV